MNRFHVHLHVTDLAQSIRFYSKLFAAEPARIEADYAKWMLDDPRVNFAISTRGATPGLDHFGMQVDDAAALAALKDRAAAADLALLDEGSTTCCYARSDKHWVTDPQGIAWEHFQTLGDIPVFHEAPRDAMPSACCAPAVGSTAAARAAPAKVSDGAAMATSAATSAKSCCPPRSRAQADPPNALAGSKAASVGAVSDVATSSTGSHGATRSSDSSGAACHDTTAVASVAATSRVLNATAIAWKSSTAPTAEPPATQGGGCGPQSSCC